MTHRDTCLAIPDKIGTFACLHFFVFLFFFVGLFGYFFVLFLVAFFFFYVFLPLFPSLIMLEHSKPVRVWKFGHKSNKPYPLHESQSLIMVQSSGLF